MRYFIGALIFISCTAANAYAEQSITITEPKDGAKVRVPFKVCFESKGLNVIKAGKIQKKNEGHHHILIDVEPTVDAYDKKTRNVHKYDKGMLIHMNAGGICRNLNRLKKVKPGKHTLSGVFTHNDHVPYEPVISDSISITVVE